MIAKVAASEVYMRECILLKADELEVDAFKVHTMTGSDMHGSRCTAVVTRQSRQ